MSGEINVGMVLDHKMFLQIQQQGERWEERNKLTTKRRNLEYIMCLLAIFTMENSGDCSLYRFVIAIILIILRIIWNPWKSLNYLNQTIDEKTSHNNNREYLEKNSIDENETMYSSAIGNPRWKLVNPICKFAISVLLTFRTLKCIPQNLQSLYAYIHKPQ